MNTPTISQTIVIDAKDQILGRFATRAAKAALCGSKVTVINCEKAYISGARLGLNARYRQRRDRGEPRNGPFFPRVPDRFVKRSIRGMLPFDRVKGVEALKRITCYIGEPTGVTGDRIEIKGINVSKLPTLKSMTVGELCKLMGWKG